MLTLEYIAGIGALLRERLKDFHCAIVRNIGYNNSITAELWAILKGLKLVQQLNITHIHIQSDFLVTIQLIYRRHISNMEHRTILRHISRWIHKFNEVHLSFVYMEANVAVNCLVSFARKICLIYKFFCTHPSSFIKDAMSMDVIGSTRP